MTPSGAPDGHGAPRLLNPFAFVSDTGLRFALLVVFVAAATVWHWTAIMPEWAGVNPRSEECLQAWLRSSIEQRPDVAQGWDCMRIRGPAQASGAALGLALLAATTAAAYGLHPRWCVWRLRLVPLDRAALPELGAALDGLCRTAGLRRPPEFWWNPLDGRPLVALAFGRPGRHRVGLTAGVAARFYADPAAFRVVLLHELAHIRNGDVGLAVLALAVWWGFVAAALVPDLVVTVTQPDPNVAGAALLAAELALVSGGVLLTRNSVLRARELYADARSFAWHRDKAAVERVLGELRPVAGPRRLASPHSNPARWRRRLEATDVLFRLASPHPDPARRRRLLEATDELFRFGFWEAFGTGMAAAQAAFILSLSAMISAAWTWEWTSFGEAGTGALLAAGFAAVLPAVGLATAAAAVITWRAAFLALMRGDGRPGGAVRTACALAAGTVLGGPALYVAGAVLALAGGLPGWPRVASAAALVALATGLFATVALAMAAMLVPFLKWVEAGAAAWLPVALTRPKPGTAFWIGVGVSCALAVPWLAGLGPLLVGGLAWAWDQPEASGLLAALLFFLLGFSAVAGEMSPLLLAMIWSSLVWPWVFPLSAWLWRRRVVPAAVAGWAFLDDGPAAPPAPASPLRPGRALLVGASTGVPAAVALQWLLVPVSPEQARAVLGHDTAAVVMFLSVTLTSALAQGVAGALAAAAVPRLGVVHGMFAASVAGGILVVGVVAHLQAEGFAVTSAPLLNLILAPVLIGGALVALPCALVACGLRRAVRAFAPPLIGPNGWSVANVKARTHDR